MSLSIFFDFFKVHKILVTLYKKSNYDIDELLECWLYVLSP